DGVIAARKSSSADLVNLIVSTGTDGACGLAYQMNEMESWFADYAFGVTALDYEGNYTCSSLTLAHEIGHGMGNAHDRANTNTQPLFPYSYGYQDPASQFRTIMAYDCPGGCNRINHWSSPDVSYNGDPTGVDYDVSPNLAADTSRSMNETARVVANFESSCEAELPPTATATSLPEQSPTPTATTIPVTPTETPLPTATNTPLPTATPTMLPTSLPTATPTSLPTTAPATPSPTPTSTSQSVLPAPTATRTLLPSSSYQFLLPLIIGD
ncbi:MAG: M12 family metallo-peptidase, partial [Chloroflexota bacterium]